MLKLKFQLFGHLIGTADSFDKTPMLGKIKGRRKRGCQRMRWLDGITDSMDMRFKPAFSLSSFTFIKRSLFDEKFLFVSCHKDGVICISEVIDISPGNLDSSLCLFPAQRFS